MTRILRIVLVLMTSVYFVHGQASENSKKNIVYKTWVTPMNNEPVQDGYLKEIRDSVFVLSDAAYSPGKYRIDVLNTQKIKFRRKGRILKSMLIGTASGFATGFGVGYLLGDDFFVSAEERGAGLGIIFAGVGAGLGALIGSIKIKYTIGGDYNVFNEQRHALKKHLIL